MRQIYVPFVRHTSARITIPPTFSGHIDSHIDEWHVDLEEIVTVGELGSYPASPESRNEADLRAIRHIDRSLELAQHGLIYPDLGP
jgi:hypothetical protein